MRKACVVFVLITTCSLGLVRFSLSPDPLAALRANGHEVMQGGNQGVAEVIVYSEEESILEGGVDRRRVV